MPTYYLSDVDITAGVLEQLATSAPASLDEAQGWTVDKKSALASYYKPDTQRAASTFVTEPTAFSQNGYRTQNALSGTFAAGTWTLYFKVKNDDYTAQKGRVKYRLWRSTNGDGSGATQITGGWQQSAEIGFTAQYQYQTGSIAVSLGAVTLSSEYLFLEVEWYATVSGGNNAADVFWVHNEGSAERLDTPALTSTYTKTHTTDGLKRATLTQSHTSDALKRATATLAHSTDALRRGTFERAHTTDGLLFVTGDESHSTDALLRDTITTPHTTDALLRATLTGAHATDALLRQTQTRAHSTDAFLAGGGATLYHTTDADLRGEVVQSHGADAWLAFPPGVIGYATHEMRDGEGNVIGYEIVVVRYESEEWLTLVGWATHVICDELGREVGRETVGVYGG